MRRTILIIPGLLSEPDGHSFLRQRLPGLLAFGERGAFAKVSPLPPSETPEGMLLGLGPSAVSLRQGPLTVSALGFDPPEKSTHFHLSLLSYSDGIATVPSVLPTPTDLDALMTAAKRLDTKSLTVLRGEEFDHGLVWEAQGDMGTTAPIGLAGRPMRESLPEGDGEFVLRRFIDDSINLLSELELNERRLDEGLPPFNLLWPWGQGIRTAVPNLALRRGEPAVVESASLRLEGLTRLAGYRHIDRKDVGRGLPTKLRKMADRATNRSLTIIYLDVVETLRHEGKADEIDWFTRELDRELIQPLWEDHRKTPSRLVLIAPGPISDRESEEYRASPVGLAMSSETGVVSTSSYPFDERALEEKAIPTVDLWTLVDRGLSGT